MPSLGSQALPRGLRGKAVIFRYRDGAAEIRAEHAKVDLPRRLDADSPGWRALPAAVAGPGAGPGSARLPLVIDDADPYRLPGYDGSLERLSVRQREQWRRRITGGWRLLAHYHPQTEAELRALIGILTPLSAADGASRSVTSRRAFGTIALSLPADDLAMALTLVHEVQHAKLCALMDLLPLVEEPIAPDLYYAPWRPDPRPLASLLQGMYAHLGVARFWWRYRDVTQDPAEVHRAHVEFARWRNACVQVAKVVSNRPELTRSGMAFVDGMIGVLRRWRDEYVPRTAQNEADRAAEEHQRQWDRRTAQRETGHERRRRQG